MGIRTRMERGATPYVAIPEAINATKREHVLVEPDTLRRPTPQDVERDASEFREQLKAIEFFFTQLFDGAYDEEVFERVPAPFKHDAEKARLHLSNCLPDAAAYRGLIHAAVANENRADFAGLRQFCKIVQAFASDFATGRFSLTDPNSMDDLSERIKTIGELSTQHLELGVLSR